MIYLLLFVFLEKKILFAIVDQRIAIQTSILKYGYEYLHITK